MKRTAAVVLIIVYCSTHAAGVDEDDGLSLLRDKIFDKSWECDGRYVATPFAGVGAEEAQEKAENLYKECLKDLVSMAEDYMNRRSKYEGKSLKVWMEESKEVSFSSYYGCYVLTVAKDYGSKAKTFVVLDEKYNPPGTVWKPDIVTIEKPEHDEERWNEIYKNMNSPHVHQRGIKELKQEQRRERLLNKAKTAASTLKEVVDSLKSIDALKQLILNKVKLDVVKAKIQVKLGKGGGGGE